MPVVKRLKIDFDGNGEETVVTIKVNTAGEFSADIPMHVKAATHMVVSTASTLFGAIEEIQAITKAYKDLQRTQKQVILINFRREPVPFLNSGIGLSLNYAVANKMVFGKNIQYRWMESRKAGEWYEPGNNLPYSTSPFKDYHNEGVIGGKSLEIDFTPERYQTLVDLHQKLEVLAGKLAEFCGTEDLFLQLVAAGGNLLAEPKVVAGAEASPVVEP